MARIQVRGLAGLVSQREVGGPDQGCTEGGRGAGQEADLA